MDDYIYETPPLVEVIAEIRWEVQKIASIPRGGIDPLYDKCLAGLRNSPKLKAYRYEEKLIPDGVPIEFFANQPLVRFRPDAKSWPLFQIGPGIFVTNLVPPYKGWVEFRNVLNQGLEALLESYPAATELLKISRLELKYIDAFRKQHNFSGYSKFLVNGLRMSLQIPTNLIDDCVGGGIDNVVTISDISFPVKGIPDTTGGIKVSPGSSNGESAVIAQFGAAYSGSTMSTEPSAILDWFDKAHVEVRQWFELLTDDSIKATFGKKKEILEQ